MKSLYKKIQKYSISVLILLFSLLSIALLSPTVRADVQTGIPAIINGLKTFTGGIRIGTDPNNAFLSNGNITAKNIYSNGAITATLDANSHVADSAVYDKHTNLDANSIGLGVARDPNYLINATNFTVDLSGVIIAGRSISSVSTTGSSQIYTQSNGNTCYMYSSLSAEAGSYFGNSTNTKLGLYTNNKERILISADGTATSWSGNYANSLSMTRHTTADTAGNILTLQSGGCTSGATDKNGGSLILSSGISTGNQPSQIDFKTATAGSTGTADNTPSTKMSILGSGVIVTNGVNTLKTKVTDLADDGTYALPDGTGQLRIIASNGERATVTVVAGGAVSFDMLSSGSVSGSTDGYSIAIYDGGSTAVLKNTSGGALSYVVIFEYI